MVTNADGTGGGRDLTTLDGTSWTLIEGTGVTIPDEVTMTLQFEGDRSSGSGGCNRFTGTYEEDGNSISFGPLASTRMACPEEVVAAESAYHAALGSAAWWSASENELVLSDSSAQELLRYEPATT
jgi:heat shock protein HslJ